MNRFRLQGPILAAALLSGVVYGQDLAAAGALAQQGRYAEAERVPVRLVPAGGDALHLLGSVYNRLGRYGEAEAAHLRALESYRRAGSKETAAVLQSLGVLYADLGRYPEAREVLRKAEQIRQTERRPEAVAAILVDRAQVEALTGAFGPAEALLTRARNLVIADSPKDAILRASIASYLASLDFNKRRFDRAEAGWRSALETAEAVLGPDHPSLVPTLVNLGLLESSRKRYSAAESVFQRAVSLLENAGGSPGALPTALAGLARVYAGQGRDELAEAFFHKSLERGTQTFPGPHAARAETLDAFAEFRAAQGRPQDAEALARKAVTEAHAALPASHPLIAAYLSNHARTLRSLGRKKEAKSVERQARELRNAYARDAGAVVDVTAFRAGNPKN